MDYKKGVLLVAYPDYGGTTEFEFKYWVDSYKPLPLTFEEKVKEIVARIKIQDWKGEEGTKALVIAAVSASLGFCFIFCFFICIYTCCKRCCFHHDENRVIDLTNDPEFKETTEMVRRNRNMRMSESSNNSNLNMLDVSNNVTGANIGETAGIRTPADNDLVIDNNLFYGNDTPDGDQEKNQDSSRPLNPDTHKRVDTRISNLDNAHGIEHESFADYENDESEHKTGKLSTKYK